MATGIDWEHPEVQKGLALFEELFSDRLYPPDAPEEDPELAQQRRDEEVRRGFALFEELFRDRQYPSEVPEEEVPETPETPPSREDPYMPDTSPEKIKTPPPKWWEFKVNPPKWLTHSMDRDLFPMETHPDWYSRFYDETYTQQHPQTPFKPPYPPSPGESPGFWDISDLLELEPPGDTSDVFKTPIPPPPPKPQEPPLPDFPDYLPDTSFDRALHQMHWELQKYEHDRQHVVNFVRIAPLVRDAEILTEELVALVKLYLPDVEADGMDALVAWKALEDYIKMTEEQIEERYGYGEIYTYRYPEITEEVLAAQIRLHKKKALDAIDTYKRAYFFALKELEKADAELIRLEQEWEKEYATDREIEAELKRLQDDEKQAELEYHETQDQQHLRNCPFKPKFAEAFNRNIELQKLIPKLKMELQRSKEAHDREVKNMANWVNLFPPLFTDRLRSLVLSSITTEGYKPVSMENYMKFVEDLESDIQALKNSREGDLEKLKRECRVLSELLNAENAKIEEVQRETSELLEQQYKLSAELQQLRSEGQNRWELWTKLREEHIYYREYNEMLLGKLIVLHAEASVESEDMLAIGGPESRSPSPAGAAPTEPSPASPPAFGSETFDISDDFLAEERPPSEMSDISDLSGGGGSPEHESPQGHAMSDDLDEERPPSGMMDFSDLSGSGGSPNQGQAASDDLEEERPPSGMMDLSDQSAGGGSPLHESTPQGQAMSEGLDEERPPSGMLDFSDLSGSGGSPEHESTLQGQALDDERPPSGMLDFSGLQGGGSFLDSLEDSGSPGKKTVVITSPDKAEQLRIDVEIVAQDIRPSPSGQRVVCDVAVEMQEAAFRPKRRIENRYRVVRGSPPISQTVGRRVDRRHGMFTPRSVIRRGHIGLRRPLFEGDFESPESPYGTGRRTHPELMNLPERPPSPRPANLDTTMDWELVDLG